MDYERLAAEFIKSFYVISHTKPQRKAHEHMRGEAFLIQFLAHENRAVGPSDISSKMGISTARTAAALGSLEGKKFITRKIDPTDRRKVLVELTSQGKQRAKEHEQLVLEHTIKLLSLLSQDEAQEYVRLTSQLAKCASESLNQKQ